MNNPNGSDLEGHPPDTEHPIANVIRWILNTLIHRFTSVYGALLLAAALAVLNFGYNELSGTHQSRLNRMASRGTVKVLDTALQILPQSGPEMQMDPDRALWHHDYRFIYSLELSYLDDRPVRSFRAICPPGWTGSDDFWPAVIHEPTFRTEHLTIRMDPDLHDLLTTTPAKTGIAFRIPDAPANASAEERSFWGSQFDQFWVGFDMPMNALAMQWMAESDDLILPVRFDPAQPFTCQFESVLEDALNSTSRIRSLIAGAVLVGFGICILIFAVSLLTVGMNRYIPIVLFLGILAAIPFGSRYLQSAIDWLGVPKIGRFFIEEFSRAMDTAGLLTEMTDAEQAGLTALPVDVEHSRYKDVFGFFHLSRNGMMYGTFAEALRAISGQITGQLLSMPPADQFRFFKLLDIHMSQRRAGWDGPFLEGVQALALDRSRSRELRSWAIKALCDMCSAREDVELAETIYRQYTDGDEPVRDYWLKFFWDFVRAPSFAEDLRSSDPVRIRRALTIWMDRHHYLKDVRFLATRLKALTAHPDPEIRDLAVRKWNSRTDWNDDL